jgi:hypothetical protein
MGGEWPEGAIREKEPVGGWQTDQLSWIQLCQSGCVESAQAKGRKGEESAKGMTHLVLLSITLCNGSVHALRQACTRLLATRSIWGRTKRVETCTNLWKGSLDHSQWTKEPLDILKKSENPCWSLPTNWRVSVGRATCSKQEQYSYLLLRRGGYGR